MKKVSKLGEFLRKRLVETTRSMTPRERLAAYVEHSRLIMEIYRAGVKFRAASAETRGRRR